MKQWALDVSHTKDDREIRYELFRLVLTLEVEIEFVTTNELEETRKRFCNSVTLDQNKITSHSFQQKKQFCCSCFTTLGFPEHINIEKGT